eukprot:297133-Lingulodinium_polyedra.AAC.1
MPLRQAAPRPRAQARRTWLQDHRHSGLASWPLHLHRRGHPRLRPLGPCRVPAEGGRGGGGLRLRARPRTRTGPVPDQG